VIWIIVQWPRKSRKREDCKPRTRTFNRHIPSRSDTTGRSVLFLNCNPVFCKNTFVMMWSGKSWKKEDCKPRIRTVSRSNPCKNDATGRSVLFPKWWAISLHHHFHCDVIWKARELRWTQIQLVRTQQENAYKYNDVQDKCSQRVCILTTWDIVWMDMTNLWRETKLCVVELNGWAICRRIDISTWIGRGLPTEPNLKKKIEPFRSVHTPRFCSDAFFQDKTEKTNQRSNVGKWSRI
jgi:hypothetical protein